MANLVSRFITTITLSTPLKNSQNILRPAKAIALYKAKIKALEEVADQHNKKFREQQEAKKQGGDNEWDSFLEKDDDWQKKNTYD